MYFVDSSGARTKITDPSVKVKSPSMNHLATEFIAAAVRKAGVRAEAMNVSDTETLRIGRSVTTGKECLPMVLTVGTMLKYIQSKSDINEKLIVFQPRAAGYCRLGQYHVFMNMIIREKKLENVAVISVDNAEA